MLSPDDSNEALSRLFRRQQVADLETLCGVLKTTSRMTVFRRLSALGYLTSYSHNGRYYTLAGVPQFDVDGLWRFQGICFSQHGSLRSMVEHLVQISRAGQTHPELAVKLQVRVHNAVLELFRSGRIGRELLESLYLYVSADKQVADSQVARRRELQATPAARSEPQLKTTVVIEILLEVIRGAKAVPDEATVRERLLSRAVDVSTDEVNAVYRLYGLKKTQA